MAIITLKNWYQLDFLLQEFPVNDLLKISSVMVRLKDEKIIDKWFFLFEKNGKTGNPTIRIRMSSVNKDQLHRDLTTFSKEAGLLMDDGVPFSDYQEGEDMLINSDVVETFANIMSEVTLLIMKKLRKETNFQNYRVIERLQHCIFNAFVPVQLKNEEYFLFINEFLKDQGSLLTIAGDFVKLISYIKLSHNFYASSFYSVTFVTILPIRGRMGSKGYRDS